MWSVFHLSGSPGGVKALFALGALVTLAFTVGLFTRPATVATFILFVSLEHRVPEIHNGGDRTAAVLLFFGAFSSLGARYSVDALRIGPRSTVPAMAPRLIQAVPLLLYVETAIEKLRVAGQGWFDGSVISANVRLHGWTRFGGVWLRAHPSICAAIGVATIVLELAVPLLFYAPPARFTRPLAVVGHVGLQMGILLAFKVAMFTAVMLAATPLWLLPDWLDKLKLEARGDEATQRARLPAWMLAGVFALVAMTPLTPGTIGRVLPWAGLDLNIGLFAWAYPSMRWESKGELEDGRVVDPLPPDADFSDRFMNSLWMQLPYRLQDYEPLGTMVCRRYADAQGAHLKRWSLTKTVTPPYRAGEPAAPEKRRVVLDHGC
jgi:hypothetical protein